MSNDPNKCLCPHPSHWHELGRCTFPGCSCAVTITPCCEPDPVNHPPHYKVHPSGIEAITITEHFNFNRGNAIKYIWRADSKGRELEDLQKARWYLDREIQRVEKLSKPS
jgi:hypothetical protein